jgi:thioredoxin-dependent peroxiredoxin
MTLQIGDTATDFEAETTENGRPYPLSRLDRRLVGRVVLPSQGLHPGLHDRARLHGQDQARVRPQVVKIIGLSVDAATDHERWVRDMEETQAYAPNYPIIGDADYKVSKLHGMLPASTSGDPLERTPADNQTVRNVFVIGPNKKVKLFLVYPMTTGRNFDEVLCVIDLLQMTTKHEVATPVNWQPDDDVIIAGSVSNDEAKSRPIRMAGRRHCRTSGSWRSQTSC